MSSRALSLATVMLLIGCFAAVPARAQNLEAGKSPSQIFAGTCTECHKSPRGLLKKVRPASLPGFLRQHYTTSGQMASVLSAYLIANGATEKGPVSDQSKPGNDAKSEGKPVAAPEQLDRQGRRLGPAGPPQEAARPEAEPERAAKPDANGPSTRVEPGRNGRNARRPAQPGEAPDAAKPVDGQAPAQAVNERGPDGRKSAAKPRLGNTGRPGSEEPPKTDTGKTDTSNTDAAKTDAIKDEPSKGAPVKEDKPPSEAAKDEGSKPERAQPSGAGKSEAARIDAPKATGGGEPPALREDPVPPVTPAPAASATPSTAVSGAAPNRTPASPAPGERSEPPAVTASAPPPPAAVAPTGPPVPPISQ